MTVKSAKEALARYSEKRIPPGTFLKAVLTNDLTAALRSADSESIENLPKIFRCVWEALPSNIWGSPQAVEMHLSGSVAPVPPPLLEGDLHPPPPGYWLERP